MQPRTLVVPATGERADAWARSTFPSPPTDCRSGPQFPLAAAAELTDYLRELGVGAVYLSPILQATSGSDHGYDITDHRRVDPDRGGEDRSGAAGRSGPGPGPAGRRRHRAQPHGRGRAGRERGLVAAAAPGPGLRRTANGSTWTGKSATARSCCRCSAMTSSDSQLEHRRWRTALLRPPIPDRARHRHRRRRPGRGARPPALPADELPAGRHRAELPPVLRRHRPGRHPGRESAGSSRPATPRSCAGSQTGTADGIRIDHPDGLANPAEYLQRLAADAPRRLDHGGEDHRAGRAAARGLAGGRHHRLRRADRGQLAALRPGRRGRGERAPTRADRRRPGLDRPCRAGQTADRQHHPARRAAPDRPVAARGPGAGRRRAELVGRADRAGGGLRGLPLLPAGRRRAAGRGRSRWPSARRPDLAETIDAAAAAAGRRRPRGHRPVRAGHRRDHGQGRRGHRLLPLQPGDRAERGRRRPGRLRQHRRRSSTPPSSSASERCPSR